MASDTLNSSTTFVAIYRIFIFRNNLFLLFVLGMSDVCAVNRCSLLRSVIAHWMTCVNPDCSICLPLRSGSSCKRNFKFAAPSTGQPLIVVSPIAGSPPTAFAESSFASTSASTGRSTLMVPDQVSDGATMTAADAESPASPSMAPPLGATENRAANWRRSVGDDSRRRFVDRM